MTLPRGRSDRPRLPSARLLDLPAALGVAAVVFASTNLDDVFLLAAFFANPQLRPGSIVLGQFLGIGALVAASAALACASLAVPAGYPALLGVVPLALGLHKLWGLRASGNTDAEDDDEADENENGDEPASPRNRGQALTVAAVTIANGGDNLGVYIPLFASDVGMVPFYAGVFAVLTAVWCLAGYLLVQNRLIGPQVRRLGHVALPFVLVALGLWILADARVLLP